MAPKLTRKRKQPQSSPGNIRNEDISTVGRKQSKKQKYTMSQNNTADVAATVDKANTGHIGPLASQTRKRKRRENAERKTAEIKNTKRKKSLLTESGNSASSEVQTLDIAPAAHEVNENEGNIPSSKEMECVICQDAQKSQDFVFLPCGHRFHRLCNDKWIAVRKCCSLCKTHISGRSRGSHRPIGRNRVWTLGWPFFF